MASIGIASPLAASTNGDVWHANPERAVQDNLRDNDLETVGWKVLRFSFNLNIPDEISKLIVATSVYKPLLQVYHWK